MNMNMNMGMNNMNINQGMLNMNQIYMQISQLMAQAMGNINQIMTNMNQLMTNMNQMNQLINSVKGNQPNNEFNNINFMKNNMNKPKYDTVVVFRHDLTNEQFSVNCNLKDKLKDVVQKYRVKSGDTKTDKFIKNNQILNLEKTIEENGIEANYGGIILCIHSSAIIGGNNNNKIKFLNQQIQVINKINHTKYLTKYYQAILNHHKL